MTERAMTTGLRATAVTGAALTIAGSVVVWSMGYGYEWWTGFGAFEALLSLFFAAFAWPAAAKQPRNAVVWTMSASAFFAGVHIAGLVGAALIGPADAVLSGGPVIPARLESPASWLLVFAGPAWVGALGAPLTFGLLLFPDGHLPSPPWRWVGRLAATGILVTAAASAWSHRPGTTVPADEGTAVEAAFLVVTLAALLSLLSLIGRFRRSRGTHRQQLKWVMWGASVFVPSVMIVGFLAGGTRYEALVVTPLMAAEVAYLGAYGIAVVRHRLFDVDVVISRTVMLGGLAVFTTAVYAVVVGGVGLLLGSRVEADVPLAVAATVMVAIAFQPVRTRMDRLAKRLVYGDRATPYEVLSRFSARMRDAVSTSEVAPRMAQLLSAGTGATAATVWVNTGGTLRPLAHWPDGAGSPEPVAIDGDEVRLPGVDHLATVEHDGELLGAVTVIKPPGEPLSETEQRLIDDLAAQAGLVLRNVRLTTELVDTIEQLRTSRERLVTAQDEERRRLERDLHDGAQQQFVAVKLKAAMAKQLAERGDHDRIPEILTQVVDDTDQGIVALRELAHGIYPPLLEAEGLPTAIRARAVKAPMEVIVSDDHLARYPRPIEAAVYFCVLEALQNVAKYADARRVHVQLATADGHLRFTVTDDGMGFEPDGRSAGRGVANMTDRLDALGGDLRISSAPGRGTVVEGSVPIATGDARMDPTRAGTSD